MLLLPDGEGAFPVAVIIHGSGTSKRDNRWYLTIAKHLQENDIAPCDRNIVYAGNVSPHY
jgi:hypothetical protein